MKPKLVFIDSEGQRTYDVVDTGTEEQLEALADAKNEALEARGGLANYGAWVALPGNSYRRILSLLLFAA